MSIGVLLVIAALAFSILTGAMEGRGARRAQRRLLARTSAVLHPLPQHTYRSVPAPVFRRATHLGLLFGAFLAVAYLTVLLLRLIWHIFEAWL